MCRYINCFASDESYAAIIAAIIGLVGALAAVIGAVIVARKQVNIQSKQTDIANRMAEIEELRLKTELYDRRIGVFSGISNMVEFVNRHWRTPDDSNETAAGMEPSEAEHVRRFYRSLGSAQFLFPTTTVQHLHNIEAMLFSLDHWNEAVTKFAVVDPLESEEDAAARKADLDIARAERFNLIGQFVETSRRLPLMFPELNLSDGPAYRDTAMA